jgi:hypothetical protein
VTPEFLLNALISLGLQAVAVRSSDRAADSNPPRPIKRLNFPTLVLS